MSESQFSQADEDDDRTVIRPAARVDASLPASTPIPAVTTAPVVTAAPAQATTNERDNTLPVGTYVGEFEVTDVLGEGGFGIVYLAWDHSLERKVALKEYMPSALAARGSGLNVSVKSARHQDTFEAGLRSFVNEAKLLAQFDHPSMVKVYRFWEANGTAYMVMPFYEGTTLKDTLRDLGQPPDEAWLMAILAPVTEALDVLHGQQCYHRDIAPDNIILLKGSGKPLLLDFGAARRVIGDMTQALTVILKSGYAPVEQYAEVPGMKQGPWTDVYALAASVFFAINGKTPPPAVGRLVNDGYVPLAQSAAGRYSERFLCAIDHALAVKPDDRTQNMGQLRQELGVVGGHVVTGTPVAPPLAASSAGTVKKASAAPSAAPSETSAARRMPLLVGGGLAALALAGGIAYTFLGAGKKTPLTSGGSAGAATVASTVTAAAAASVSQPGGEAVVAAPTLVPNGPFSPVQEFERIVNGAANDFSVEATATKPRFKIGKDRLSFSFTSSKSGYAYVLLYGTDGSFLKLFPNKMSKPNRVTAGEHITLPHASWPMDVTGPAGIDHFVVIVSSSPRDFSALGEQSAGGFIEFPLTRAEAAVKAHKGPGSAFAGKVVCDAGVSPCTEDYGAAHFTLEETE